MDEIGYVTQEEEPKSHSIDIFIILMIVARSNNHLVLVDAIDCMCVRPFEKHVILLKFRRRESQAPPVNKTCVESV